MQPQANIDDWFNVGLLEADIDMWNSVDSHFFKDGSTATHTLSPLSTTPADGSRSTTSSLNGLMTDANLGEHVVPNLQYDQYDSGALQLFGRQQLPPVPDSDFDYSVHLSVLQRNLSKQLFTLKSMPWDMATCFRLTCMHNDSNHLSEQDDLDMNPLAKIASTSAEFAALLCSLQTPQTPMANDGKNSSPMWSVHPHLSTADLLTILSCHWSIISIYDSIFSHFADQALHNPGVILQSAPKLCLGGIAVPPRLGMLSDLLYCLTGSHLRPIEMLLGLPDEYCVSFRRSSGNSKDKQTGVFSDQWGQSLFSTLMKVETERASEERDGLGVIESLKEKMKYIQTLE